jgi:hypothetical protein
MSQFNVACTDEIDVAAAAAGVAAALLDPGFCLARTEKFPPSTE